MAGECYSVDHDGYYPPTLKELHSDRHFQQPGFPASFVVTADTASPDGGYSYFIVESATGYNAVVVAYGPRPTWQEVIYSMLNKGFDRSNLEEQSYNPSWAESTAPVLDYIGSSCGSVDVRLARGLNYGQVLQQVRDFYESDSEDFTVVALK